MKKVLILEGSPRPNGNSCILSNEFARGAEESGCSVEKLLITRKKLQGVLAATTASTTTAFVFTRTIWQRSEINC